MRWRDKHIAHQVDNSQESVVVAVAMRGDSAVGIGLDNPKELTPSIENVALTIKHIERVLRRLAQLANALQSDVREEATPETLAVGKDVSATFLGEDYGDEIPSPMGGFYRTWTPSERKGAP
jgi:hypothetical protein